MKQNLFAAAQEESSPKAARPEPKRLAVPDYTASPCSILDHILAFFTGFAIGFAVLFIFYKIILLAILGGVAVGVVYIFVSEQTAIRKRVKRLRIQFFDMLEAMSVSMRAGNPVLKALESAREDLVLIYGEDSDIIAELGVMISRFRNAVPLSQAFADFAERSGLEDAESFASVYATIEGKSSRADEIVRETQQIIADKIDRKSVV